MFAVDAAVADAIREALQQEGELAAIVEFRRHFPALASNEHVRTCVLAIASWRPATIGLRSPDPNKET